MALPREDAQQACEVLTDEVGGLVHRDPFTFALLVASNNLRASSMLFDAGARNCSVIRATG